MSELDDLRAAETVAISAWNAAGEVARAARHARIEAECAILMATFESAGGVVGVTPVRIPDGWGPDAKPNMRLGPFFVMGATRSAHRAIYRIAKIKKDGSPSMAAAGYEPEKVHIVPEDQP